MSHQCGNLMELLRNQNLRKCSIFDRFLTDFWQIFVPLHSISIHNVIDSFCLIEYIDQVANVKQQIQTMLELTSIINVLLISLAKVYRRLLTDSVPITLSFVIHINSLQLKIACPPWFDGAAAARDFYLGPFNII